MSLLSLERAYALCLAAQLGVWTHLLRPLMPGGRQKRQPGAVHVADPDNLSPVVVPVAMHAALLVASAPHVLVDLLLLRESFVDEPTPKSITLRP